jgi:hypothetical protein
MDRLPAVIAIFVRIDEVSFEPETSDTKAYYASLNGVKRKSCIKCMRFALGL